MNKTSSFELETESLEDSTVRNRYKEIKKDNSTRKIRSESPPSLRPFRHKPYKTIFLSFFLLLAGTLFVTVGAEETYEKGFGETYPYFLLGILLLIPGVYHVVIIVCIWVGVQGFTYEMLPKTDN